MGTKDKTKQAARLAGLGLLALGLGASAAGVAYDFDGDGKADPAVYTAASGNWSVLRSRTGTTSSQNWGWDESRPVCGDFDGDSITDIAVYHRYTLNWYVRGSSGVSSTFALGMIDARAVPGDYDGDGKTDLAVYQRVSGIWLIRYSSTGAIVAVNWGWSEGRPVQADYDGDGKTDVAVFERATASWYILKSTGGSMVQQWGWSQTRPVPADYDGDGKADIAVYHLASGTWYIQQSSNGQLHQQSWGWIAARPVPGNYDGDAKTDIAVYYAAAGTWYILPSSTGTLRLVNLGGPNKGALPSYMSGGIQNLIILAVGDSITYGQSSSSDGPLTGYPLLLERICEPALGGHCVTINAGKPGETTGDGRVRLNGLLAQYKPDLTLIMEGTNDEFFSVPYSTTESNLRAMVLAALNAGSSAIISTIPPVIKSAYRDRTEQEQRIEGFNPRIFNIASSYGILAVDTWSAITSKPNWQNTLMDQETANHPNDAGYLVVRDTFFNGVKQGLQSGRYY